VGEGGPAARVVVSCLLATAFRAGYGGAFAVRCDHTPRPDRRVFINKIVCTGQAAFVDDDVERVTMVQIKPRKSKPGGSEA